MAGHHYSAEGQPNPYSPVLGPPGYSPVGPYSPTRTYSPPRPPPQAHRYKQFKYLLNISEAQRVKRVH